MILNPSPLHIKHGIDYYWIMYIHRNLERYPLSLQAKNFSYYKRILKNNFIKKTTVGS